MPVSQTLTIDFNQPIPLFPLAQCVLLPHATVPLHVFEPRYREMVSDILDSAGLIAMAVFEGDEGRDDDEGSPPIRPYVCIGYLLQHHRLEDGRYNLLLHGVCRAHVEHETDHQPYRTAMLKPIEHADVMEIDLDTHRSQLETMFADEHISKLAAIASIHRWLNEEIPTLAMIDLAAMALYHDTPGRYAILAEPDPAQRVNRLMTHLIDVRRCLRLADRFGPALSKEGYPLN